MKILREGDRGYALAPERGRVEAVYEVRGAIVAAKEDVLDDGARERQRQLEAIARAI